MVVGTDTEDYTESCHRVQCYVEGCRVIRTNLMLDHNIQGCVGLCNEEQWATEEHGDAWGCVVVCQTMFWSTSASQHVGYMWGAKSAVTQEGYMTVQDGIAVAGNIRWYTGSSCSIQWHDEECKDTWWYVDP